jgi:hypothetical protein
MPKNEARKIIKPCSRPGPQHVRKLWGPNKLEIATMESKLSKQRTLRRHHIDLKDYYLQYAGIVVGSRRLIYISAAGRGVWDFLLDLKSPNVELRPDAWKTSALITCDGGFDWGLLYNVRSGKFYGFEVNGIA